MRQSFSRSLGIAVLGACILMSIPVGDVEAKSVYLIADHSSQQFQAWNINPGGTVTYQATYTLQYSYSPGGVALLEEYGDGGSLVGAVLFVASEFSTDVEMVDAITMTSLGKITVGPGVELAGIDADSNRNIFYAVERGLNILHIFDWDPTAKTLTEQVGSPVNLPGCSGAMGIAFDESSNWMFVADFVAGYVRAYDVSTWTQVLSYQPAAGPMDVVVDSSRGLVYTVQPDCFGGSGQLTLLCQYDIASGQQTSVDMGSAGMGIAVDEATGFVYITHGCSGDTLSVWDTSSAQFTLVQRTGVLGNAPAGIVIGNKAGYSSLEFSKDDDVPDDECRSVGEYLSYDICFNNILGSVDVYNVLVTDSLPLEVDFVLASDGGVYDPGTHTVTWDIGKVLAEAPQRCLQLKVTALPSPTLTVTNYATIEGGTPPDDIKITVAEDTKFCGLALVAPLNGRINYLSPEMLWQSSLGPRALYVVDFLLPPSGSIISIPPRQDTKWKVPDSTWSKVPRGSKIYWRVRGLDPDATPPVVFTSEAWRFYKY